MAQTKAGAAKAKAAILAKNPNFYAEIGKVGGSRPTTGGFKDKELAKRAGAIGGRAKKKVVDIL
jgi:general stress protein YciG